MSIMLSAQNVIKNFKQYDQTITAVNRVNLDVEDGEFVAIIGASGSGKSTFLGLCGGQAKPDHGNIFIRGNDITKMKEKELAEFRGQYIGYVFQKHNLIPSLTALENILIPTIMCNKIEIRYEEHLKRLISMLGLSDRINHLPSELSGGQQQRVAIARALINRPQILLADEPTGNLDNTTAEEVLDLLLKIKESTGQTLIIVTHNLDIADRADKIYKMHDGELFLYKDAGGYKRVSYEKRLEMER